MRRRAMPSPAMVVALIALFVALGGTGYAASTLSDNGSAVAAARRHHRRSLRGPRGFRGRTGPQGPQGPAGAAGAQGPAGTARAYAEVRDDGTIVTGHAFNITNANITHPIRGEYCFDLSALGITRANAVPVATPDWGDPGTSATELVQVSPRELNNSCPGSQVEVRGWTSSAGAATDVGFTIVFP
jgi:hypothetical protein